MALASQYEHACEHEGIAVSEGIRNAIHNIHHRKLQLRHEGSLQPQLATITVGDQDMKALCLALRDDATVSILDLRYNRIGDQGCGYLKELLEVNRSLLELWLDNNDFGSQGAAYLADALQINATLKTLRLKGNKIGDNGSMAVAAALQINRTLTHLSVADTDMEMNSFIAYMTVLKEGSSLTHIDISRPLKLSQQEETIAHVADMLMRNQNLEALVLQKHNLTDSGFETLSQGLKRNSTLKSLDLSRNRMAFDGARELAVLLTQNQGLEFLDLSTNRIGNHGAHFLAQVLPSSSIKGLNLAHNEIQTSGVDTLLDVIRSSKTLVQLMLWGNPGVTGTNVAETTTTKLQTVITERRNDIPSIELDLAIFRVDEGLRIAQVEHESNAIV